MSNAKPDSLIRSFSRMFMAAGDQAPVLKISIIWFALAAIFEGLALSCFFPLFDRIFYPDSLKGPAWPWLAAMALAVIPEAAARWVGNGIFGFSHHYARVGHSLRIRLGLQLRQMPMEELNRKRTGELTATLSGNVDEITTPMGTVTGLVMRSLLTPLVVICVCFFYDWRIAAALALLFPLALPLYQIRRQLTKSSMESLAQSHTRTASEILEYTQGLAVLRSANTVGERSGRLKEALDNLENTQAENQGRSTLASLAFMGFVELGSLLVLAWGVFLVLGQSLALPVLAALLVLTTRFAEPLSMFWEMTSAFDYMDSGLKRVEQLFAIAPLPATASQTRPKRFDIQFKDVSFTYLDSREPALEKVSCTFPSGGMTALVGPSGSGKTTITRLIMRHADPGSGSILMGGHDLRAMGPDWLMRQVSVVFQEVYLFDDTILDNIRMGNPDATDDEVKAAARKAGCREFIRRLPQGYNTRVGEIGGCLSGGEKQRISIARALLKDTPIVILDEPTAALDTESEVAVQKAVDELVRDRTVIVIAHRLSTVAGADQIFVFDQGRLVQSGTHESLILSEGRYGKMWEAQQQAKSWHRMCG